MCHGFVRVSAELASDVLVIVRMFGALVLKEIMGGKSSIEFSLCISDTHELRLFQ